MSREIQKALAFFFGLVAGLSLIALLLTLSKGAGTC